MHTKNNGYRTAPEATLEPKHCLCKNHI